MFVYGHNPFLFVLIRIIEYGNKKEKSSLKALRLVLRTKL